MQSLDPSPKRKPEEIREELRQLRENHPTLYARHAATLLDELKRVQRGKRRYAIT